MWHCTMQEYPPKYCLSKFLVKISSNSGVSTQETVSVYYSVVSAGTELRSTDNQFYQYF